jgi:tetratricopeptide (TPR) repeat protein
VNVEHLLDVFTSIDVNSDDVWDACDYFMKHLYWYKKRHIVLRPKIEGLPDDHRSKPACLFQLSRLLGSVGNSAESKRLLVHTLKLWRERGNNLQVAQTLRSLADTNRLLNLHKEGIRQVEEALKIYQRENHSLGQAYCWQLLAWLLFSDNQLDAAEAATSPMIKLFSGKGQEFDLCQCHRLLGEICRSKGKKKEAINHLETALRIASPFNWHDQQFSILHSLAELSFDRGRPDDAHTYIERAKSHALNSPYILGHAMQMQARFWYRQERFEEARAETLCAVGVFEKLGATKDMEACRTFLQRIEERITNKPVIDIRAPITTKRHKHRS